MSRHFRIHPAFGVARMGNSPEHFIGPETPGVPANVDSSGTFRSFRDNVGRVLRQGARFRVFEYEGDASGALVNPREVLVGGDITDIEWRVHLANRKASFFVFDGQNGAKDLYAARAVLSATTKIKEDPDRTNLRNADVAEAERSEKLDIDPGEKLLSAAHPGAVELSNTKQHIPITSLGTLRLDEKGRLIVLGGYGESHSTETPPRQIDEYANNDTWFDDSSDGTVKARIRFSNGSAADADPAWVTVGPPDFAPGIGNVVTLFDTLWDTAVRTVGQPNSASATPLMRELAAHKVAWNKGNSKRLSGFKPSFTRDIYPLIKRALGARDCHLSGASNPHFHLIMRDSEKMSALEGPLAEEGAKLRSYVFNYLRDPDDSVVRWEKMPRALGDDYTALDNDAPTANSFLSLTRIQYALIREWADGNFIADWAGAEPTFQSSPEPTPDELDRAAAEGAVGGPFFPGIEVSWLIRVPELYQEPFRLKVPASPEEEGGGQPTLQIGALQLRPGFFSQQMALPWQADFYDCHEERHEDDDGTEYYFMWWTAQRPDHVFLPGSKQRDRWVREFDKNSTEADPDDLKNLERFTEMQQRWHELKFLIVRNVDHFEEEP